MAWLAALPLLLCLIYAGWQGYSFRYWRRASRAAAGATTFPTVAIIVPFRDEAHNLPTLLDSLLDQDYPRDRYEIILVDDHSTDGGFTGRAGAKIALLKLADGVIPPSTVAYKKLALTRGIARTRADLIVTTDADCSWPVGTLRELAARFDHGADVVLGPVFIGPVAGPCAAFQALDLAGYQLFTAASVAMGRPTLANGAHFAFRRAAFYKVGGYDGVDHLPSGDDVLLLHKFIRAGLRIGVLTAPGALVTTHAVSGWRALWRQRLRWAGKAGAYASPLLSGVQALAYLTSLGVVVGLVWGLFDPSFLVMALLAWAVKAVADYVLLRSVCRHYGRQELLSWYGLVQLIHPFYLVGIGTAALLGVRAEWKGRRPT